MIGSIWLFGLMTVEGILLMSGAHADDSGLRMVLAIMVAIAIPALGLGVWVVSVVWRSWRTSAT